MSAQQIRGRLQAHHDHGWLVIESDCGGLYIKVEKGSAASKSMPAARRLVACWNACEGTSTEALERGPSPAEAFQREQERADLAERQRDELLAALDEYEKAFTELDPSSKASRHRMRMAKINARAVIAKVKGGGI